MNATDILRYGHLAVEEYALDDFMVYGSYEHKREHTTQVAVFRDTLEPSRLRTVA